MRYADLKKLKPGTILRSWANTRCVFLGINTLSPKERTWRLVRVDGTGFGHGGAIWMNAYETRDYTVERGAAPAKVEQTRPRAAKFDPYRYYAVRDGGSFYIVAGCQRWDSFFDARMYYEIEYGKKGAEFEDLPKAKASLKLLANLRAKCVKRGGMIPRAKKTRR
jgi:hypothetical protein